LWAMAVINALAFWALLIPSGSSLAGLEGWSRHLWAVGIAPLVVAVLNGLLPVRFKETIVFWRISHPLPGTRAFTTLAPHDSRIDLGRLRTRHGALPEEPTAQNQLWYRIYKTQDSRPTVSGAH